MADFNRDYHATEWGGAYPPPLSPANLNNIEAFIVELDDRTKDLHSDKLGKSSDFARRAEEAEAKATSAQAKAEQSAEKAEEAASKFSLTINPSYTSGDVIATFDIGGETTTVYGNVKASDVTSLEGRVSTLALDVADLADLVGDANEELEAILHGGN